MIKAVRGTRDLLPPETALWNFVETTVRDVFRAYNFQEIRTPIFEDTQLFARGVGEETDIVSKEMYTWPDGHAGRTLANAWLEKHPVVNRNALPSIHSVRPDLVVETEDSFVAVEANLRPDVQSLERLSRFSRAAEHSLESRGRKLRLLVVFPSDFAIDEGLRQMAKEYRVELEALKVDLPQFLTLRPENTAGVVRAYIEHKLWERGLTKLYYIGPQFRRERPQKGRYRQFYQIGAEVIGPVSAGSESPARDAEILELLATLLDRLGIKGWQLQLNSIGCAKDRAKYNAALRQALEPVVQKMCADCRRRAVTNPLRVFDCKVPADQPIIETLPRISQFLDDDCREHFREVQEILQYVGVPFTLNDRLVRGLDYYTRTAFEFTHGNLGAQNAILGGGRYDGLSEALGGPPAPGIGFAIGEDRLVMSLGESAEARSPKPDVYIAPLGGGMNKEAAPLARELRRHDLIVELGDQGFRLKKSLETASKLGARYVLIVGENEVSTGVFALKELATGKQESVARPELVRKMQKREGQK
jgi:histidyl-tRNA synthetase